MKRRFTKLLTTAATVLIGMTGFAQTATMSGTIIQQPCNNDGQLSVTVNGMTAPISYTYYVGSTSYVHNNVNSTTDLLTGIPAILDPYSGQSTIYVYASSNSGGLYAYGNFTLTPAFTYSVSHTIATCPSPSTLQVVNMTGGTAPYTFLTTNIATSQSYTSNPVLSNVSGYYNVQVTDAAGCVVTTMNDSISVVSGINVSMTGAAANCTNGAVSVSGVTGGTAPYTYSWNNGATSASLTNVIADYYTCVVTDANGCSGTGYYYVQQVTQLNINSTITNATCIQNNGAIMSFVTGGTAPYSYNWDNGATTANISGLAGNHSYGLQVVDSHGCVGNNGFYVSSSTPITVTYTTSPSSCTAATGAATLYITGGVGPYTTTWNTSPVTTGSVISNMASGSYAFHVTDANGCVQQGSVYIPPVSVINAYAYSNNPTCPSTTGSVYVSASSSNPPLTYAWNTGATTASVANATVGSYQCVITDAAGCQVTKYTSVYAQSPVNVGVSSTQASCIYAQDGSAFANAWGGTSPYSYHWSNGQTTATATGLGSGYQWVNVTDANGCGSSNYIYVGYNAANNSCYCTIQGTVFVDANNNCVHDAGETGIPNVMMHCSGFGYAYTNTSGVYQFMVPTGTYTISETVLMIYPLASCQSNAIPVSVTASSGCVNNVNFANNSLQVHDLNTYVMDMNQAVPGQTHYYRVVIQNDGTMTENTVQTSHTNDGQLGYLSSSNFNYIQPNAGTYPNWYNITSGFPSLSPGTVSNSILTYQVPTNIPLGTQVNFFDTVVTAAPFATNWLNDNSPWNNVNQYSSVIIGSFDPNFKEVNPRGTGTQGYITTNDSTLRYTIHFQNTGSYYAQNIVVVDSLDSDLNIASLRPGYADHNYTTTVSENGVIKFHFNNIQLPWQSGYGDLASSGSVSYSIKLKHGLTPGTQIKNKAAIYFDYNAPVITNTTLNTIQMSTSVNEITKADDKNVHVYPNPAADRFKLVIHATSDANAQYSIYDLNGRLMHSETIVLKSGENILEKETSDLNSGIYFIQVKTGEHTTTKKLIVIK
ncbi:MAG: T9SS type A sorting domain-containing protein [Bacteroidetes bacterium]|nr:T9SS type A sorting domain-containing protein [Bacteroidota bacterium]